MRTGQFMAAPGLFMAALVATLCLGIAATLNVIDYFFVDLDAGECPAGCLTPTPIEFTIDLLILAGSALSHHHDTPGGNPGGAPAGLGNGSGILAALVGLSIGGALAIGTSALLVAILGEVGNVILLPDTATTFSLYRWLAHATPSLLLALAPLPGLVWSLTSRWRPAAPRVPVFTLVALASLAVAGGASWDFT